MGGHPYWYYVDYEANVQDALDRLRRREFAAGRYNPVVYFPRFPVDLSDRPGSGHASIDAALEDSDSDGTRSILDLSRVSTRPHGDGTDLCMVAPVGDDALMDIFGTLRPSRDQVEQLMFDLLESIERGTGLYLVVYDDDAPTELFFAGYSFD